MDEPAARPGAPDLPRRRHRRYAAQAAGGGIARFARPHRRGRGRRAAAPRAQPPRRRAAAPRLAVVRAPARAREARGRSRRRRGAPRQRERGARPGARGAPRARAGHPPGDPHRPRPRARARVARRPRAGASGGGHVSERRTATAAGRGGRVLRRLRGTCQRGQVRARALGRRPHLALERLGRGRGRRRRRRRRRSRPWLGPARPRRPGRGARGPPRDREPSGRRDDNSRRDPVRVVLGEDSVLLREGVARLLREAGFEVVGQASNADELMLKVRSYSPDVAIVDIRMPPTHTDEGLRAAQEIREKHPATGLVVLSQYAEPAYAMELLADSAEGVGYLLKDRVSDVNDFCAAVKRVAEGGSALDPTVVSQLVGRRRRDDPVSDLTPRETEVLELMAEGRSNQAIGESLFITPRAVEKHVTSIFGKLGLPATAEDHRRVLAVLAYLNR